jgi:flagellar M-ring protein FliF
MGFLNQSITQIRDLFASMTPAARITAALLVGVIGVSLAYLFQGYAGGSKEFLFNGEMLQPREADAVESAIAAAGLSDFERQGNRVLVPRGQKAAYLAAVANGGALPANFDTLLLDESDQISWLTDSKTRDARMKAARERQLSMLVRMMDGVAEAQVLYDVRENTGFERKQITATVSIRPAPGESLTPTRERMIRLAVCKAIAGLEVDDVAILNLADASQTEGGGELSSDAIDSPYFRAKLAYEQIMKAKVEDVLRHIPGVRVQIMAELDDTLAAETHVVKPDGEPQTLSEETDKSTDTTTQVEDRGRPGLTANGPGGTPPDEAVAKNEQRIETDTRTAESWVPTSDEVRQTSGLVPQHVRAAIAIPSDFIVKVWRERTPDAAEDAAPTAADITNITDEYVMNIESTVSQLFPREPEDVPYPNVKVTVFQSLTPPPLVEPSTMSRALMWAGGNSGSLIMAGLALVSLVMLRSMVKSIPPTETSVILQTPMAREGAGEANDEVDAPRGGGRGDAATGPGGGEAVAGKPARDRGGRPKLKLKKGASLKDDLTDLVREDPDAAAAILRNWISSAG